MKSKVIVINNIKSKLILLIAIIFLIIFIVTNTNKDNVVIENVTNDMILEHLENSLEADKQEDNVNQPKYNKKEIDFPNQFEEVEVIGKLEIPKINLTTYILAETNKENLNKSVTKLCGPKVNGVGNICITGHNYHKERMFGKLKQLEKGDKILLTDMKGITIEYEVYDMYKVYPKETNCLSQDTGGERHITLITCTTGAIKRLIVKAVEIYD